MLYNFIQGSRILVLVLNEMVCKHLLLIPEVLSNGLNFASLHGPLISLSGFKNTNHVTTSLLTAS